MTNNPTIDGLDRETLAFALGFKCHGHKNRTDQQADKQNALDKIRAVLDAPVVERQPVAYDFNPTQYARNFIDSNMPPGKYIAVEHYAALQSTIARLEARIAELESGRSEPIYEMEYLGEGGGGWAETDKHQFDATSKLKNFRTRIVFTVPPAPVAVVLPERATESNCDKIMKQIGMYGDMNTWHGALVWNACLDATAALNKP